MTFSLSSISALWGGIDSPYSFRPVGDTMVIYCDRLAVGSCIRAIQIGLRKGRLRHGCSLRVLDPLPRKGWGVMLRRTMRLLGFKVEEAPFFAGHLKMPDGQSVYTAAYHAGNEISFRAAEDIVVRSRLLTRLNQAWGSNTIRLYIAKSFWRSVCEWVLHIMVAAALAREDRERGAFLVVRIPPSFNPDLVSSLSQGLRVHFYSLWNRSLKQSRLFIIGWWVFERFLEMKSRWEMLIGGLSNPTSSLVLSEKNPLALLLLQEDELSLDRSYRTQPHWLYPEDGRPPFRTIILRYDLFKQSGFDPKNLEGMGVVAISPMAFRAFRRPKGLPPFQHRLRRDLWSLTIQSVLGHSSEVEVMGSVARLFYEADRLASFCRQTNVKAFMACENYIRQADAMQLIAPALNIHTLSYQYSNLGDVGPVMMTTADIMLTFSPLYHKRWAYDGIQPKSYIDIGYVFDRSFQQVRDRAHQVRSKLVKAGAHFVICYLDESVQFDKYGLIDDKDHHSEFASLIRLILADPSLGLVVKTQFQRNSPQNLSDLNHLLDAAKATSRYIELSHGTLRNIVFPAEAAMCADIVIGHSIGGTASLEAALAGARCILLNPYGFRGENDSLYAQADIIYATIDQALEAIQRFRTGTPEREALGDWSPILHQFDPFRDGQAATRIRQVLEKVILKE